MTSRRFAPLLVLASAFWALAALAAELPQKVVSVEGVTEYRLENGLRVLTVPDASADTVTVHITYFVGSRHEGYGEKGMAHLLEHLLFKGSPRVADVKAELTRRGARYNGTTSYDRTTYFETLSASDDNLDWTLAMEADRMVNAFVRKSDLDSEMSVVRNEFESGENSPGSVLYQRMQRLAFAFHNYGNPVIGARSDIESAPIERLQAFYRAWYRPDNAMLIVGGRFDESRALAMVAKHFGPLARPAVPPVRGYTVEPTQDGERDVTLRRAGDTQIVAAMYRVPSGSHPDYPALEVLAHALGTAPTGRLHRALVQKGLASSIWGYSSMLHDPGFAYFGATLAKDAELAPARAALIGTLEGLAQEPLRDDEIERARTSLLNDMEKVQIESPRLIRWLAEFAAVGDWRLLFVYRDGLRKVTAADVQRLAGQYLLPANRVLGVFMPTAQPARAEIPPSPDVAQTVATYRGTQAFAEGEAFDPSPQNIESRLVRRELANGIRVALLPKKTRGGNVHASLSLYWGDEQSKMNRGAACTLAGSMLMRGSRKHTRAELQDAFDRLKANVSVGVDGASIDTRREQLADALRLVAEVLREPAFPDSEFEELKRSALTGAESRRGDPAALASEKLTRHLNPYPRGHWLYTNTTDERLAEIKEATLADAKRCYAELVGASGAHFVAVGDFDPEEMMKLVEQLFADWRSPAPYQRIAASYFERPPIEEQVQTPDKANAVLRAGVNLKLRDDHPDFAALVLANWLLGGTSTGRLPARVREKEGLSYSTYSHFSASALDEAGGFGISAIYAPQNRARVERAIREELERARKEGFDEAEVEAAKKGFLEARRLQRAQDRALAGRMANYLFVGRNFAWDVEFEKKIAALTAAQVHQALRRHIDPARLSVLKAGDFKN